MNVNKKTTIKPYVNDIYALRPDLLKFFFNEEDAIGIPLYEREYKDFCCPDCGSKVITTMNNITRGTFSCPHCRDTISYPERFMRALLNYLDIDFEYHYRPIWCKYMLNGEEHDGEYDFVNHNQHYIIEMDGHFHSEDFSDFSKYRKDAKYIDDEKDRLAKEYGYVVYRVDCVYDDKSLKTRFEYIKNSTIESLSSIIPLNDVDWNEVEKRAMTSIFMNVIKLWNRGLTTRQIVDDLQLAVDTVVKYLNRGNELNLCWYTERMARLRGAKNKASEFYRYAKVYDGKTNELIGVMYDIDNFICNYNLKCGYKLYKNAILKILRGKLKTTKGVNDSRVGFEVITKEQYDELIKDTSLVNDIIDFPLPIVMGNVDFSDLYEEAKQRYSIDAVA